MALTTDNIQIKHLNTDDLLITRRLFFLLQEVFEVANITVVNDIHLKNLLQNPAFIVFAAFHGDELAGGLTAYKLPMYNSERSEVYIYDIAVKADFQRKGIGKKLLSAIQNYCAANKIKELFVQANEEDEHALDFYRATGASGQKVVQFTYRT